MSGVLPHSAVLANQFDDYLKDSLGLIEVASTSALSSQHARGVFKTSLASFCVLGSFAKRDLVLLKGAAEISRRLPLLGATRQRSLARIELRRFIELVTWYPYFAEHPIEWEAFQGKPKAGFVRTIETPISYCAHRERLFYSNYIAERFYDDASGLIGGANEALGRWYTELSFDVHAASDTIKKFSGVIEEADTSIDAALQKAAREVMAAGCLVVAAVNPRKIHALDSINRGWFDWLIGRSRAKAIRSGALFLK
jgi:hypothetical protein